VLGRTIVVGGQEAHHILDVMRLKPSDEIVAFDGTGKEYFGIIKSAKKRSVLIDIIRTAEPEIRTGVKITLIQAVPKKAKMDYIVEKATELGASAIIPVFTDRTIPDWDDNKKLSHLLRWRKIALEASKQSSRKEIPAVSGLKRFSESIRDAGDFDLALIATLAKGAGRLKDVISGFGGRSIAIAIGPEGDFTSEEITEARAMGFNPVSLGSRILRSDTAGLAVLAMLDYEISN
jgi:16S rRNA (uracil1498-N3)-methyltransferase